MHAPTPARTHSNMHARTHAPYRAALHRMHACMNVCTRRAVPRRAALDGCGRTCTRFARRGSDRRLRSRTSRPSPRSPSHRQSTARTCFLRMGNHSSRSARTRMHAHTCTHARTHMCTRTCTHAQTRTHARTERRGAVFSIRVSSARHNARLNPALRHRIQLADRVRPRPVCVCVFV